MLNEIHGLCKTQLCNILIVVICNGTVFKGIGFVCFRVKFNSDYFVV